MLVKHSGKCMYKAGRANWMIPIQVRGHRPVDRIHGLTPCLPSREVSERERRGHVEGERRTERVVVVREACHKASESRDRLLSRSILCG